jgi:hypothetical protein
MTVGGRAVHAPGWILAFPLFVAAARLSALDAITPDATLQSAIAKVPAARDAAEMEAALDDVKAASAGEPDRLVPQLIYFSMRATDVRAGMTAGVVIDRLQIPRDALLHAIVPYLDSSETELQRQLANLLSAVDETAAGPPDFSCYRPLLRERSPNPPPVLVVHMLDTDPELALSTLADVLIADPAARASTLAEARSAKGSDLEKVAEHDAWWVRLYVIHRAQRDPSLRTPALMQRLRADPHPAVRAAVKRLPLLEKGN